MIFFLESRIKTYSGVKILYKIVVNFDTKYITNRYAHRNAALNPDTLLPPKLWIWSITMRSGSVTMLRAFGQMTTIENFDQSWQITPSSSYKGADFKNTCSSSLKLLPFAAAAA